MVSMDMALAPDPCSFVDHIPQLLNEKVINQFSKRETILFLYRSIHLSTVISIQIN